MKKEFNSPEMEIQAFTIDDVITTSGSGSNDDEKSIDLPIDRF